MKTKDVLMSVITAGVLMFASVSVQAAPGERGSVHAVADASARDVAAWLGQPARADALVDALAEHPERGLPLTAVLAESDPGGNSLASRMLSERDDLVRQ